MLNPADGAAGQHPPVDELGAARAARRAVPWPTATYGHQTWRRWAACRSSEPDVFFPVGVAGSAAALVEEAKAMCATCPVREACLHFAFATNQEFGVWGGLDEDERRAMRRRWRNALRG